MSKILLIFCLWVIFEKIQIGYSDDYVETNFSLFGKPIIDEENTENNNFPLPPQHMLELYEIYSGKQHQYLRYRNANVVRSFTNKDRLEDQWHYFFDLKGAISMHEEVLGAEFRFLIDRNMLSFQNNSSSLIKIQLFEGEGYETSTLVEERIVNVNSSRWEEFKVKSSVKKWCDDPESNRGFSLKILDFTEQSLPKSSVQNYTEPALIVYSRNSRIAESTLLSEEFPRSVQANTIDSNSPGQTNPDEENSRSTRAASRRKVNFCARYDLKIDFGEIGWSHWVIRPKWYNAYSCKGACVFGRNQNTTVHARMQSLVHHLGLSAEAPCCVPTELEPLAILFYDKDSNPILAKFDEMIVAECGCR